MTVGDMIDRTLTRLGDDPNAAQPNQYYIPSEALAWINAAQRITAFLTLFLETTATFSTLDTGQPFYSMLQTFSDWMLPLRVRLASGAKVRPMRLQDLGALDANWTVSPGTIQRYCLRGFDLLGLYQQPPDATPLSITYARSPVTLVSNSDVPELPDEYHPTLIDAAIVLCRAKEGAQEFQKVQPLWNAYLDEVGRLGELVTHRSKERGYDRLPVELARIDRSRLFMEVMAK